MVRTNQRDVLYQVRIDGDYVFRESENKVGNNLILYNVDSYKRCKASVI
jgi:hypothetical protein